MLDDGEPTDSDVPPKDGAAVFLLIHGTGSASLDDDGTLWYQRGSATAAEFDRLLAGIATADTRVFHWSGKNSERERANAAAALMERLVELERDQIPYHLVGHSHGGSIIWMVLRKAVLKNVDLRFLRSWTTLGTPFLGFAPAPIGFGGLAVALLAVAAAVAVWATVRLYAQHVAELWKLHEYTVLALLPVLWIVLASILIGCLGHLTARLRAFAVRARERGIDSRVQSAYRPRYMGLWSPNDEAINGLETSVTLSSPITPRLRPDTSSMFAAVLSAVLTPFHMVYNSVITVAADDFIWDSIKRSLQGNDLAGFALRSVTPQPDTRFAGWPPIPAFIDDDLVAEADASAARAVSKLRKTLGLAALAGAGSPEVITGISPVTAFGELVHNSYYTNGALRSLIAFHVYTSAECEAERTPQLEDRLSSWYRSARDGSSARADGATPKRTRTHRVGDVVWNAAVAATILIIWLASSNAGRSTLAPLTDEYQVRAMVNRGSDLILGAAQPYEWVRALGALGNFEEALHSAGLVIFQADSARSDAERNARGAKALVVLAAMSRAAGRLREATHAEGAALAVIKRIANERYRSDAADALAKEMGSFGVDPEAVLNPQILGFSRNASLRAVAARLADAGRTDLGLKVLSEQTVPRNTPKPLARRAAPPMGSSAPEHLIVALLKEKRYSEAVTLGKKYGLGETVSPQYLEALLRSGQTAEVRRIQKHLRAPYQDQVVLMELARIFFSLGKSDQALEAARRLHDESYDPDVVDGLLATGHRDLAVAMLRRFLAYEKKMFIPSWSAKAVIDAEPVMERAGLSAEAHAAVDFALASCLKKWRGGSMDSAEILALVDELIRAGRPTDARTFALPISEPALRASALAHVATALADAHDSYGAEAALKEASEAVRSFMTDAQRAVAYRDIAVALAHLHRFREAREAADTAANSQDTLAGYGEILIQFATMRDPSLRPRLEDARSRPALDGESS